MSTLETHKNSMFSRLDEIEKEEKSLEAKGTTYVFIPDSVHALAPKK